MGLRVNNDIYVIEEYHHVKPGKGSAFVRIKLRNLKTNLVVERTFKSSDKLEDVFLEQKVLQYLYRAGDSFHFMDQESFEEHVIDEGHLGEATKYLQDNLDVTGIFYDRHVCKIVLPTFIISEIVSTEPGIKGDSARAGNKPAQIDTGANVQVPLFINNGDYIKVDTRTGQYVERVKK